MTFHTLRHTFGSWLTQHGRSLREVQEALGHATIMMAVRYSHLAPEHLRAAVAALDDVMPSSARPAVRGNSPTQDSAQEVDRLVGVSQKSA